MIRFVIVENFKGQKVGYVEINLQQIFGNIKDSAHDLAMRYMESNHPSAFSFNFGSKFVLSNVLKKEPKKLHKF